MQSCEQSSKDTAMSCVVGWPFWGMPLLLMLLRALGTNSLPWKPCAHKSQAKSTTLESQLARVYLRISSHSVLTWGRLLKSRLATSHVHAHILLKSLLVSFIPYHFSMGGTDRPVRHRETMLLSHSSCRLGYHATQPVWIQHGQWNGAPMQGRSCTLPFGSADPYRLRKYQW